MRVKLDENLPASLGEVLTTHGHDVDTVLAEDLAGHPDPDVAAAVKTDQRFLITLDKGFGDIRAYPPGTHPGILVLRLPDDPPSPSVRPSPTSSPATASTTSPAPSPSSTAADSASASPNHPPVVATLSQRATDTCQLPQAHPRRVRDRPRSRNPELVVVDLTHLHLVVPPGWGNQAGTIAGVRRSAI